MVRLFAKVLNSGTLINMTLTGSVIILFVLIARLCLKRAPKVYSYCLWGVVLFRLLCPVSITAPVSALNIVRPEVTAADNSINLTMYVANVPAASRTITNIAEQTVMDTQSSGTAEKQADPMIVATAVWAMGLLAMAGHGFVGFFRLRKKLVGSVEIRQGVYLADGIDTPFVLGILHPQIYLPSGISIEQRPFILAHERYHIHRFDMLWKLLGYMALCLHWFNPLVWVAFVLAGKDMEMSCDEAVLRKLDSAQRADYASALLRLSTGRRTIAGTPLAFGEGDTKGRIKNMAKWKKPKVWVSLLCVLLCIGAAAAFLTNPKKDEPQQKYKLIVGSENVYSIQVSTPNGSGGCSHADNTPYAPGEQVWLEPLEGLDNYAGVSVEALGQNGERIWFASIPDTVTEPFQLHDGTWYLISDISQTVLNVGPCGFQLGSFGFRIPEDTILQSQKAPTGSNIFHVNSILVDNEIVGGTAEYEVVDEQLKAELERADTSSSLDWINQLPFPERGMENIGYFSGSEENGGYSIEFFSDVPEGVERTVLNIHYLYYYEGSVYDIWFDKLKTNDSFVDEILGSVQLGNTMTEANLEHALTMSPDEDWLGFEISAFYDIGPLPGEFHIETGGDALIMRGTEHVGTITAYPIPLGAYDPEDTHFAWLERRGISDFGSENLYYEGGMSFSYNRWMARFTGENPRVDRYHYFQISGNFVFDICFDSLLVDFDTQQALLAAIQLKAPDLLPDAEHTIHSQSSEEETAYQTISAFLNALQENQAAYVVQDRQPVGAKAPGARNSYLYLAEGNLYYNETEMLPDGTMRERAVVRVERQQYTGTSLRFGDDLTWSKTEGEDPYMWLTSIDWNRQTFQYVATMNDSNGTVYLYHSDFWFEEDDGGYFVNFYFNEKGQFDHVTIRVNQFMDNDYEVVESVLNTDSATISEWINREYQKAIG